MTKTTGWIFGGFSARLPDDRNRSQPSPFPLPAVPLRPAYLRP
ncbi:hypothetical protein [Mesorhizobium sp.]|nr:hypothetical protein [Mesorhizobium sp.]